MTRRISWRVNCLWRRWSKCLKMTIICSIIVLTVELCSPLIRENGIVAPSHHFILMRMEMLLLNMFMIDFGILISLFPISETPRLWVGKIYFGRCLQGCKISSVWLVIRNSLGHNSTIVLYIHKNRTLFHQRTMRGSHAAIAPCQGSMRVWVAKIMDVNLRIIRSNKDHLEKALQIKLRTLI